MSPPLPPEPPSPAPREQSDGLDLRSSQNQRLRNVPGPRFGGDAIDSIVYGPLFGWAAAGYGIGPLALDALLRVVDGETKADVCREGKVRDAVAC